MQNVPREQIRICGFFGKARASMINHGLLTSYLRRMPSLTPAKIVAPAESAPASTDKANGFFESTNDQHEAVSGMSLRFHITWLSKLGEKCEVLIPSQRTSVHLNSQFRLHLMVWPRSSLWKGLS
jgi:hypothetical protein